MHDGNLFMYLKEQAIKNKRKAKVKGQTLCEIFKNTFFICR